MARNLYRFYLYAIFIASLIFAVSVTAQLLATLFAFTPLRGTYENVPSQAALAQAWILAIVGWIISGVLGGLHYWLIRRDLRSDPSAGASAIRAFFLNIPEALGTLTVVPLVGFFVLNNWAYGNGTSLTLPASIALPTLAFVLLLEGERRRASVEQGAALVFQRLHFFGVQLILLFLMTSSFLTSLRPLLDGLFFKGQGYCGGGSCPSYNLLGFSLTLLWFVACWLVYSLATRQDTSAIARMILHGGGLAFGSGFVLAGVFFALELALHPLFKLPVEITDVFGAGASYDFVSPLVLGLLVSALYHLLLTDLSQRHLIDVQVRRLTEWVIAAVLLAGAFWWGLGYAIFNLLRLIPSSPNHPDALAWIVMIALLITGLGYLPLELALRRQYTLNPAAAAGPRRGMLLALLGAGLLAFAIGGAVALYAWLTSLLGSPLTDWPQVAQTGLAAALIGVVVAGIYLWEARTENLLVQQAKPGQPPVPVPPASTTIESILDELLAGHISRDEAARRIRALEGSHTGAPLAM